MSIFKKFFILALTIFCFQTFIPPSFAEGGLCPEDPMVRITAPAMNLNKDQILINVSREVSRETGVEEKYITYYWQTFDTVYHAGQKLVDKPIFVDLYTPGFFDKTQMQAMMTALGKSIGKHTGAGEKWVFIHVHYPMQGGTYIDGQVQNWKNYKYYDWPKR